jgi:molybdopterin-guanine dinucleotide biosynthesis protein A
MEKTMSQRIGLVLAGGAGSRLGREKGSLDWDGRTLADRAARLLHPICSSVLISVASGAQNPAPDWPSVTDASADRKGPLAGIDAAFAASQDADLLVLACDYPLVDLELLKQLCDQASEDHDLVMPTDPAGRDHPLVAAWSRRMQPIVRRAVAAQRLRVHSLFVDCRILRLHPDMLRAQGVEQVERKLLNVNRPEDLDASRG